MSSGGKGGGKKGGSGSTELPPMPQLPPSVAFGLNPQEFTQQTTQGVVNPYGASTPIQNADGSWTMQNTMNEPGQAMFDKAWSADAGKEYSDALFSQMIDPHQQEMFSRGLPQGSEINDTALGKLKMQALLGAHGMVGQDRQQAMSFADRVTGGQRGDVAGGYDRDYQSRLLPWQAQIDRENLEWGGRAQAATQDSVNRATEKASKNKQIGQLGEAGIGYLTKVSDIKLKENIELVGKGINDLNLYEYNYSWSPTKYRGYMAQEVQEIDPEHVINNRGILMVTEKYAPERLH